MPNIPGKAVASTGLAALSISKMPGSDFNALFQKLGRLQVLIARPSYRKPGLFTRQTPVFVRNTCRVGSGSIWPCRMRTSIGLGDYVREVVLLRCYSLGNGGIWPSMTRTNTCLEGSETMAVRGPRKRIFRPISC